MKSFHVSVAYVGFVRIVFGFLCFILNEVLRSKTIRLYFLSDLNAIYYEELKFAVLNGFLVCLIGLSVFIATVP